MTTEKISETELQSMAEQIKQRPTEFIKELIDLLLESLQEKRKQEIVVAKANMEAEAQALGFESLNDFLQETQAKGAAKVAKVAKKPTKKIPIRYRDTEVHTDTWTGRGKQPKWLVKRLDEGRKIEEFELAVPEAPPANEDELSEQTQAE